MKSTPLHTRIQTFARAARLPGLVYCRFDTHSATTGAWGYRDLEAGRKMTADSIFPIASVTKTFTAHLLQRAAQAGLLDLDAPIRAAWPSFAPADPAAAAGMTPREALGHLSGLPPHTWAWVFGDLSRSDFFQQRFPHLSPLGPFREQHRYSNLMYAAMGQLLEEATGQDWESRLQNEILEPLGMRDTHALTEDWAADSPRLARPYGDGSPPQRIPFFVARARHLIAPASELLSTAPDLARWGQSLLSLPPDDLRWRAVSRVADGLAYGLGWRLESWKGVRRVWHSGQCSGYTSLLSLFPERGRGEVLLCNRSGAVEALHAISRLCFAPDDRPPPSPEPPPANAVGASSGLSPFSGKFPAGAYAHPGYGTLSFFEEEGRVWSRFQNADAVEMAQDLHGRACLVLPVYGVRFHLRVEAERLFIPFEPAVPEIVFNRG